MKLSPVILALAVLVALPVEAGVDAWTAVGQPPGASINHTVVDPAAHEVVYTATQTGLFKSSDAGAHWTSVFGAGGNVWDVALEPEAHDTLYIADGYSGVYVSKDGGATWVQSNSGITGLSSQQPASFVVYVSADPVNDGIAYASTASNGVFKTADHGQHWTAIDSGFPTPFVNGSSSFLFGRVVVDPTNTQTLYLPLGESGPFISQDGIYKSTDGGASWSLLYGSLDMRQLVLDLQNTANLYAIDSSHVLYYITSSGANQTGTFSQPLSPISLAVDPSNDQDMVAGTSGVGLYVSSDGGGSWNPAASTTHLMVEDVAMDPTAPATLYVGTTWLGIYNSTDGGATLTSGNGVYGPTGSALAIGSDRVVYMGTENGGMLKSTDLGVTWSFANSGIADAGGSIGILALVQDPATPSTLYVGTALGSYKSTNGGGSWSALTPGLGTFEVDAIAIDPENTQTLYAGAFGIAKSTDGGASWSPFLGTTATPAITALAVDPTNSNVIYAGMEQNGIYATTDGGAHWSQLNTGIGNDSVLAIGVDPNNHRHLYVTVFALGVLQSEDAGASWTVVGGDSLTRSAYTGIVFDPADSNTIYLDSSLSSGIEVTHDGGTDWISISNVGDGVLVGPLVLDPQNPATLYGVGTDGQFYTYGVQVPTVSAQTATTVEDTPIKIQLGYSLPGYTGLVHFNIVTQAAHGTLKFEDATPGTVTYTPAAGFTGQDNFTFTVTVGAVVSAPAKVTVMVTAPTSTSGSTTKGGGGGMDWMALVMLLSIGLARKFTGRPRFI